MPHSTQSRRHYQHTERLNRHTGTRKERGYGSDWERFRDAEFARQVADECDPLCRLCKSVIAGMPSGRALLDHLIPPTRIAPVGSTRHVELHRHAANLIPVCKACNDTKNHFLPHELSEPLRSQVEREIHRKGTLGALQLPDTTTRNNRAS